MRWEPLWSSWICLGPSQRPAAVTLASTSWRRSTPTFATSSSSTAIAKLPPVGSSKRTPLSKANPTSRLCAAGRERFPERSVYNRLADLEWDSPLGAAKACGGDSLMRAAAFRQVNGFDPSIIAAEEDELCLRIRRAGWKVLRIDAEMTLHDIAMTRFGQWWRRGVRCGMLTRKVVGVMAAHPSATSSIRPVARSSGGSLCPFWLWVLHGRPTAASLVILFGYLFLYWRIHRYGIRRGWSAPDARRYALACVVAKFSMLAGVFVYCFRRIAHRPTQIIEYKLADAAIPDGNLSPSIAND